MLRYTAPFTSVFAGLLLACLLVIVGSAAQDVTGGGERAPNPSSLTSHNADPADPLADVPEAAATLAEQSVESLSLPAESAGDETVSAATSAQESARAHTVVHRHTDLAPSRDIRHSGRGPPTA